MSWVMVEVFTLRMKKPTSTLGNLSAEGSAFVEAPDMQNVHCLSVCFQFNRMTKEKCSYF